MPLALALTFGLLIIMTIGSVKLSGSGILVAHSYVGWIYILVYMLIYIPFVAAWHQHFGITVMTLPYIIMFIALIYPLSVLGSELAMVALIPDPSKGLKPLKVYSAAERKVSEDDLPGAIAEYELEIARDPKDVAARLRLADLCSEAKQYEKAVTAYEALAGKPRGLNVDQHCSVLTRLSELYSRHLGQMEKARVAVQEIIERYPDTNYAKFAEERLKNL